MNFKDKNVYITGGSSGIGLAIAKKMAAKGANVLLISRNIERLNKAKNQLLELTKDTLRVEILSLDVTDNAAVKMALTESSNSFGKPDVLVNCAGYAIPRKFEDIEFEQFDSILKTNLHGPWNTCAALINTIKGRKGYIVNVSSIAGFIGVFGYTDYCASKFGLIGLSEALRSEYEQYGVKVSVLCPPDTDTPAFEEENKTKPEETKAISGNAKLMSPEKVAQALINGMKKGKFLIVPGFDGKLAKVAKGIAPELVHYIMQKDMKKAAK